MLSKLTLLAAAIICPAAIAQPEPARVSEVRLDEAIAGKRATLVLIKDSFRFRNDGPLLKSVEFQRYTPVIDAEQFVLGRWLMLKPPAAHRSPSTSPPSTPTPAAT